MIDYSFNYGNLDKLTSEFIKYSKKFILGSMSYYIQKACHLHDRP